MRFHLVSLINSFQYRGQGKAPRLAWQPEVLQRLLKDLDHWREDRDNPVDHLLAADLRSENGRPAIAEKEQWEWAMWDAERLGKHGLKPGSEHKLSELSDEAFQECEDAQSSYIDRWVAERFRDDVRQVEEENGKREVQKLDIYPLVMKEGRATPKKALSANKARRKDKVLARDILRE